LPGDYKLQHKLVPILQLQAYKTNYNFITYYYKYSSFSNAFVSYNENSTRRTKLHLSHTVHLYIPISVNQVLLLFINVMCPYIN